MIDISDIVPWSVALSVASIAIWVAFLLLALIRREPRHSFFLMGVVAILVGVGMLASAWGSAQSSGAVEIVIDRATLALVAGMGRGALLMGGIFALASYRPTRRRR